MAIALVAAGSFEESPSNSYTFDLTIPTHSTGDLLVAFVHYRNDIFVPSATGWTQIYLATGSGGNDSGGAAFYRVADGTEGSTVTFTNTDTGQAADFWCGSISAYSGVDAVSTTSANAHRVSDSTPAAFTGTLPTVGADDWVLYGMGHSHSASGTGTATVPTGTTQVVNGNATNNTALAVARYQPGSTPSPAPDWSIASMPANTWPVCGAVILEAAAGGGATATPGVVAATSTVPAPTASGSATATPSTVAATSTVPAPTASVPSATTIWALGGSITGGVFDSANDEACADLLEAMGYTVTRVQGSTLTTAPTTADCDCVIWLSGSVGGTTTVRGTDTDAAPIINLKTDGNGNSSGNTALISSHSYTGASSATYRIKDVTEITWTAGYSANDDVTVYGFSAYQEELATPTTGYFTIFTNGSSEQLIAAGFDVGETNLASATLTARMIVTGIGATFQQLNAAGQVIFNDMIAWCVAGAPTPVTASPSTVAATTAVPAPTASVREDRTATPGAVAGTSTVPAPTVSTSESAAPGAVAVTSTVPSPTAGTSETATPGVVAGVSTVETPSISTTGDATASPTTVAATVTVESPTPTVPGAGAEATPSPVAAVVAVPVPTPSVSESRQATPAVVAATTTTPAPTPGLSAVAASPVVAVAVAALAPTLSNSSTASPAVVAVLSQLLEPRASDAQSIDFAVTKEQDPLTGTSAEPALATTSRENDPLTATSGEPVLTATSRRN